VNDLPEPIPAATLILMRPSASGGPPDLLMIERSAHMAFAAGALVFPGGRIDPDDEAAAARLGIDDPLAPARIAAVRETIEETGIAPALLPEPGADEAAELRRRLAGGAGFVDLLDEFEIGFDLEALTPFARWCPNFREARRFDTFFFIAEAPEAAAASADCNEAVRTLWAPAAQVLAEAEAKRAHIIFPTRRNLERLARFASIDEARDSAARHEVRKITPWVEERDGGRFVCIPEDAGYPVTAEPIETAMRR
jgi:8-oxo-dGTP pyrophosphatase MutT (NUDIX family)